MTKMTDRIPVTPLVRQELKKAKEETGADSYDAFLRSLLADWSAGEIGSETDSVDADA